MPPRILCVSAWATSRCSNVLSQHFSWVSEFQSLVLFSEVVSLPCPSLSFHLLIWIPLKIRAINAKIICLKASHSTVTIWILFMVNMDNFKLNFLSWGQLKRSSLDNVLLPSFKMLPYYKVFLVTQCDGCPLFSLLHGGLWLDCQDLPAVRAVFI